MTERLGSDEVLSEHRLELGASTSELRRLSAWLHERLGEGFPPDALFALDLGLQESVANAMSYAFGDGGEHAVSVTLRRLPDRVEIEVEDDGVPFDPLSFVLPALPERLEDLTPGGHGIRLMRRFLDGLTYRRSSNRNHLVMTRRVSAGSGP
jgi:serine/threonine-protein kinase RsbW